MRQVALERRTPQGAYMDVAWIEVKYARVGKRLRIEGKDNEIWTVVEVYGTRRREWVDGARAARRHFSEVAEVPTPEQQREESRGGGCSLCGITEVCTCLQ